MHRQNLFIILQSMTLLLILGCIFHLCQELSLLHKVMLWDPVQTISGICHMPVDHWFLVLTAQAVSQFQAPGLRLLILGILSV